MEDLGYYRTWSQCHVKIKSKYRKIRDGNNETGNDRSVLGTRPASQPDTVISSSISLSGPSQNCNNDGDETDDDLTYVSKVEEDGEQGIGAKY